MPRGVSSPRPALRRKAQGRLRGPSGTAGARRIAWGDGGGPLAGARPVPVSAGPTTQGAPWRRRFRMDRLYRRGGNLVALTVPFVLLAIAVVLAVEAVPALRLMGFRFLTTGAWRLGAIAHVPAGAAAPPGAAYGILPEIMGTAATTLLALVVAVPVGGLTALFLTEWVPRRWEPVLSAWVELLAGIPSVVYGLWGLAVVAPLVAHVLEPLRARASAAVASSGPASGLNLLTTGLVLAVMVLPMIAAGSRDALRRAPPSLREGALALGLTRWETTQFVVLPHALPGLVRSTVLGLGRALGETMAVLMLGGAGADAAHNMAPDGLGGPVVTMASALGGRLAAALRDPTGMALHALAALALVLFLVAVAVQALGGWLARGDEAR